MMCEESFHGIGSSLQILTDHANENVFQQPGCITACPRAVRQRLVISLCPLLPLEPILFAH